MADGDKGLGKSKTNDITYVVFIHYARHRFLEDQHIGETGPAGLETMMMG